MKNNTEDKYLDIGRMIGRLKAHGYDGPLALEFMWPYQVVGSDLCKSLKDAIRVLDYQIDTVQGGVDDGAVIAAALADGALYGQTALLCQVQGKALHSSRLKEQSAASRRA